MTESSPAIQESSVTLSFTSRELEALVHEANNRVCASTLLGTSEASPWNSIRHKLLEAIIANRDE